MKKTKTHQSKTEELYELVAGFSDDEVARFESYAKLKRSRTAYRDLFEHLRKIHREQGLVVEQIREREIKASVVGQDESLWGSYRSLCRNLYRKLLAFLMEQYRHSIRIEWREKISKGLDEVETLADRGFFGQAAARLLQVEQWVPKTLMALPWQDLTQLLRLGALKVWLKGIVDFVEIVDDDEIRAQLYAIAHIFRPQPSQMPSVDLLSRLQVEGKKMFAFRVAAQMLATEESDCKQIRVIDRALKTIQSSTGLEKLLKRYANDVSDANLKSRLVAAFTTNLSLRKVGLLIDMGEYHEAIQEMKRFRNISEQDLSIGVLALLTAEQKEIGLATAIIKSEDASINIESEYVYSEQLIQDFPIRIEVNTVLMLAYSGDYSEALKRTKVLMEKRPGPNALKPFIIELKLLECILRVELASTEPFDYECLRRLKVAIHNHDAGVFEKAALAIIDGIGNHAGSRIGQSLWLNSHVNEVQTVKTTANRSNPLHQYLLYWIRRIKDA